MGVSFYSQPRDGILELATQGYRIVRLLLECNETRNIIGKSCSYFITSLLTSQARKLFGNQSGVITHHLPLGSCPSCH